MEKHSAEVTLLESFDLGKNTGQRAGMKIKIFAKGSEGRRGRQLGTIKIGQGSFEWWSRQKQSASIRLDWSRFADIMADLK